MIVVKIFIRNVKNCRFHTDEHNLQSIYFFLGHTWPEKRLELSVRWIHRRDVDAAETHKWNISRISQGHLRYYLKQCPERRLSTQTRSIGAQIIDPWRY